MGAAAQPRAWLNSTELGTSPDVQPDPPAPAPAPQASRSLGNPVWIQRTVSHKSSLLHPHGTNELPMAAWAAAQMCNSTELGLASALLLLQLAWGTQNS